MSSQYLSRLVFTELALACVNCPYSTYVSWFLYVTMPERPIWILMSFFTVLAWLLLIALVHNLVRILRKGQPLTPSTPEEFRKSAKSGIYVHAKLLALSLILHCYAALTQT